MSAVIEHEDVKKEISYTNDQIDLIKSVYCSGATDQEFQLFLAIAEKKGLSILDNQIYSIQRGNKRTIQTSIDGFRLIASRTGRLIGNSDATFVEKDGKIISASVTIKMLVGSHVAEFTATAYMDEYMQVFNGKPGGLWARLPRAMLSKCAEALALRKAAPNELSGLYTADELSQADSTSTKQESSYKPKKVDPSPNTEILEAAFDVLDATQTLLDNAKIIAGSGQVALREWYSCLDKNQKNLIKDRMQPIAELAKEFDAKEDISNVDAA
jgi:phage recombination protein Bet